MAPSSIPNVLVVDDDPDIHFLVQTYAENRPWRVIDSDSGADTLRRISAIAPSVIVIDIGMPEMDGYALCERVRELPEVNRVPIIFASASSDEQDKARAFALGAVDYLAKPLKRAAFIECIELHLDTRQRWLELSKFERGGTTGKALRFIEFRSWLQRRGSLSAEQAIELERLDPRTDLPSLRERVGIADMQLARLVAEFLGVPLVRNVDFGRVDLRVLPPAFCKMHRVVPCPDDVGPLFVVDDPFNGHLESALALVSGRGAALRLGVTSSANMTRLLAGRDARLAEEPEMQAARARDAEARATTIAGDHDGQSAPIVLLVNRILTTAYDMGASDIHVEPSETEVTVRNRVDGELVVIEQFRPANLIGPIVARIKILARLDISERRLPQDGRYGFRLTTSKKYDFDVRVSTIPVPSGEKVVMRILDKQRAVWPLEELGYAPETLAAYRQALTEPYGLILHAGPTGSGKSLGMYAALASLRSSSVNICTAEDPIEYTFAGINQVQMHPRIGLTFASAVRAFMRQDPDIILVGEIRDRETADAAVEAALTGHLVFSTLHTNDATATVLRFREMGIEPYMYASSVVAICAQRLVRRLCGACRRAASPTDLERHLLALPPRAKVEIYQAAGCDVCNGSGYKGRVGVHELLLPDERMRTDLGNPALTVDALRRDTVTRLHMVTMYWDGVLKVRSGVTSCDELMGHVRRDDFDTTPRWLSVRDGWQ